MLELRRVRYRRLGSSDLDVSEISLGSWLTYGGGVDRRAGRGLRRRRRSRSASTSSTRPTSTRRGAAEEFLGEVLADRPRDSYVLATKLYFPMNGDRGLSREQVFKQIDASLARLRTDYVDLYQCHRYDCDTPLEETMEALTEVVRQGKARYLGLQRVDRRPDPGRARAARRREVRLEPAAVLAALARARAEVISALRRQNGISQIVWSPLAQGTLTGKYKPGEDAGAGHARRRRRRWAGRWTASATTTCSERSSGCARSPSGLGITMAQLALAWVLARAQRRVRDRRREPAASRSRRTPPPRGSSSTSRRLRAIDEALVPVVDS